MRWFDALDPTDEQIAALIAPLHPENTRMARDWTAPTAEEIARLAATPRPVPQRPIPVIGLLLAAAAILLLQLQPTPPDAIIFPPPVDHAVAVVYSVPVVPLEVVHTLQEPLALGPSIRVEGAGEVRLLAADEHGTVLELLSGSATFEVDPDGEFRDLAVHTGAVTVLVTGTRFTVSADPISVSVERGSVRILHPDGEEALSIGGYWSVPPVFRPVQLPPAPTLPMESPAPTTHQAALEWSEIQNARDAGVDAELLLERIDRFIVTVPGSALAEEASAWRLTLLAELYPPEEILGEVDDWLIRWPTSYRRGEVLLLRATLTRLTGDCLMARAYYRAVLDEPAPPLHAEAQQWLDRCETP